MIDFMQAWREGRISSVEALTKLHATSVEIVLNTAEVLQAMNTAENIEAEVNLTAIRIPVNEYDGAALVQVEMTPAMLPSMRQGE